jgi:hypothetical protein
MTPPTTSSRLVWAASTALLLATVALADGTSGETDVQQAFHYVPNKPVAIVAGILYLASTLAILVRVFVAKNWWALCLPIGSLAMAMGFFLRFVLVSNQNSTGLFIAMQVLILCSPGAFLAFNYILYGRFIVNTVGGKHSLIRPDRVARVFVISDVVTFLIQATGGSMGASNTISTQRLGSHIVLVGLTVQTVSYILFIALCGRAHLSIRKEASGNESWWRIMWLLYFSSVFITIRCIYRLVELAQGFTGYLFTHEVWFYVFDSLPLFLAISVYIPYWPGNYLSYESREIPMVSRSSIV